MHVNIRPIEGLHTMQITDRGMMSEKYSPALAKPIVEHLVEKRKMGMSNRNGGTEVANMALVGATLHGMRKREIEEARI